MRGTFELQLAGKSLQWDATSDISTISGQPKRLLEAAENLLSNAIKYSPVGQVIALHLAKQDGHFSFSVRDHGSGVPDNEKLSIFEPFVRGESAALQGIPGTGVGLSIVSECALAHSGEIFVEDAQPGSRFVFRWPDQS